MKKLILSIIVSLFIVANVLSQEIRFGVKGGLNISKFNSKTNAPFSENTGRVGFHVGGLIEISLNEKFAIQPELLFSTQGSNINSGERELRLNYLQLPVMGKYKIVKGLSAEAGPVLGYLLSAKFNGLVNSEDGRETIDIKDGYKSVNVALGIGASYKLKSDIFFGLRYNIGLSNINNEDFTSAKTKNNVFQLSVGYLF